jgi:hypothetical protein
VQWRFAADGRTEVLAARRTHARYWHNQPNAEGLPPRVRSGEGDESTLLPAGRDAQNPSNQSNPPDLLDPAGFLLD